MDIKRSGFQPSAKGSAEYFTGTVRIDIPIEAHELSDQGIQSQKGLFAAHTESTGRK